MDGIQVIGFLTIVVLITILALRREQRLFKEDEERRVSQNKSLKKGDTVYVHINSSRFVENTSWKCNVEDVDKNGRVKVSKWFNPRDIYPENKEKQNG